MPELTAPRSSSVRILLVLSSLTFLSLFVIAAEGSFTPEQADKFLSAKDWKNAAAAYDQLTRSEPSNGRYWLRLGVARIKLHDCKAALPALDHAEQLGFFPERTRFELAIAHAGINEHQAAIEWLTKAVAAGFSDTESLD